MGVTVGLGEIFSNVAARTPGGQNIVSFVPVETSLSDINGNLIVIDSENPGTITIAGGAAVP